MNVLSLCDGMSCGRMALIKEGFNVENYYAAEIKDIAIKATQTNFPDTKHIGDVTKISYKDGVLHTEKGDYETEIDLMLFGSPCFARGTLVLTRDGYKNIEDICVGDYVFSHDNSYHRVTAKMMTGIKQIYEIKCQGSEVIKTTSNHKFYVRENRTKRVRQNGKQVTRREFGDPEWVAIKELMNTNKRYYVGFAINKESKLPTWNGIEVYNHHKKCILNNLPLDNKDFWYIVGRFLGDGWVNLNYKSASEKEGRGKYTGIKICCNKSEVFDLKQRISKVFKCNVVEEKAVYKFQIYNMELAYFLAQFKCGAANKVVPTFVMDLPVDLLRAFLEGYFDADGHYEKVRDTQKVVTVSRNLAYGIEQCIAKVYHRPCSFIFTKRPEQYKIEGRTVNQRNTYTVEYRRSAFMNRTLAFYEDGYIWYPIRSIISTNYREEVFDITVEDSHSFTANGVIVHNCQSFSRAMNTRMRVGLEDKKRSGLFLECYRIMQEVRPRYFLMENVIMKPEDVTFISDALGVTPIRINSSLVSAQLRDRLYWTNIPGVMIPNDHYIYLNDILDNGFSDKEKARALLVSDSRPLTSPRKMLHRYWGSGFTTVIFQSEDHYCRCREAFERTLGGLKSTAEFWDNHDCPEFVGVRYLSKLERARLQTVPEQYVACMSDKEAADLLGDGWTVDVIAHIFSYLNGLV